MVEKEKLEKLMNKTHALVADWLKQSVQEQLLALDDCLPTWDALVQDQRPLREEAQQQTPFAISYKPRNSCNYSPTQIAQGRLVNEVLFYDCLYGFAKTVLDGTANWTYEQRLQNGAALQQKLLGFIKEAQERFGDANAQAEQLTWLWSDATIVLHDGSTTQVPVYCIPDPIRDQTVNVKDAYKPL